LKSGSYCPTYIKNITDYVTTVYKTAESTGKKTDADAIQDIFGCKGMRYDDFMFFFADIFVESV